MPTYIISGIRGVMINSSSWAEIFLCAEKPGSVVAPQPSNYVFDSYSRSNSIQRSRSFLSRFITAL